MMWFYMFWKLIHEHNWFSSREFTRFCEQIWCVVMFTVKSWVFHVMTHASETVPVLTQYDSCQTRSKLVTTGRTRIFTWIHMKTHTGGVVPIMNQCDRCQLVQKWFFLCWVIINAILVVNYKYYSQGMYRDHLQSYVLVAQFLPHCIS